MVPTNNQRTYPPTHPTLQPTNQSTDPPPGLSYPLEIDLKFIKPVVLGGSVSYQVHRADAKKGEPRLIVLVTNADQAGEVHVQGTLRSYKP
jgi:acyl dehydratase